ncbi:MAG: S8 family serine peptidase, partial [Baekduiaceae bacterium]
MGWIPGRRAVLALAAGLLAFPTSAAARPAAGPEAKLDSALTGLVRADERGASVTAAAEAQELTVTPGERVLTEIYARTTERTAQRRLGTAGADVRATAAGPGDLAVVTAWVPVSELEALAAVSDVQAVLPVQAFGTDVGAKTSQGVAAHQVPQPPPAGADGAGVKVGVISDSIDQVGTGVAGSQATGDLPASVSVLSDQPGARDEGRAMAEIVYDMAPGITEMAFASGTVAGAAGKVAAIDGLVAAGAKVIADDIAYLSEPFFQDGQVTLAVDRARDAGVLYLASAGNRARQSYESAPRFPAGDGVLHDFDAGAGTDTTQSVTTVPHNAAPLRNFQVTLQWDEPWGQAENDLDLSIIRLSDGAVLASGTTDNIATGLPREIAAFTNATGAALPVGVRITRAAKAPGAADPTLMKYIALGNFGSFTIVEHDTSSDAINPDAAAAKGSLAVAAVKHDEPGLNDPEPFSSRGPKQRLFDKDGVRLPTPEVRQKPDIAAADGVSTTVPTFTTFFGTSAAVPSAAGIAALALSAKPTMPLSLLRAVMTDSRNSNDCTLAGLPDLDCGWGFVLAGRAVAMAQDTPPPTATPVRSPETTPTGTNGWYGGDVSVTWSLADAQSPAERVSGCAAVTRTTDGQGAVPCSARSVGGTTTESTVLKRDATAPTVPTFAGITATTFTPATVPAAGGISCSSTDATSGLASCVVTGHSADPGSHTLTATATDNAGNTSTATLTYSVAAPAVA